MFFLHSILVLQGLVEGWLRVVIAGPNLTLTEPYLNPIRTLSVPYPNPKWTLTEPPLKSNIEAVQKSVS